MDQRFKAKPTFVVLAAATATAVPPRTTTTLCEKCFPDWKFVENITIPPLLPCDKCGVYDSPETKCHVLRRDAIADAAFAKALHEANLKLPIKHATRELKEKLDEDLGTALRVAIERVQGKPLEDLSTVAGRLSIVRHEGDDGDTYYLDETPILWGGPIKLGRSGDDMSAERALRILVRATELR
jgi:hypothetical protein